MKILYICAFFMDVSAISILAFRLLEGMDSGSPAWMQLALGSGLVLAIALLALFIKHYMRSGNGSNNK